MIRRLQIIVGETVNGQLRIEYCGRDRGRAREVMAECLGNPELEQVEHLDRPRVARRKWPAKSHEATAAAKRSDPEELARESATAAAATARLLAKEASEPEKLKRRSRRAKKAEQESPPEEPQAETPETEAETPETEAETPEAPEAPETPETDSPEEFGLN